MEQAEVTRVLEALGKGKRLKLTLKPTASPNIANLLLDMDEKSNQIRLEPPDIIWLEQVAQNGAWQNGPGGMSLVVTPTNHFGKEYVTVFVSAALEALEVVTTPAVPLAVMQERVQQAVAEAIHEGGSKKLQLTFNREPPTGRAHILLTMSDLGVIRLEERDQESLERIDERENWDDHRTCTVTVTGPERIYCYMAVLAGHLEAIEVVPA